MEFLWIALIFAEFLLLSIKTAILHPVDGANYDSFCSSLNFLYLIQVLDSISLINKCVSLALNVFLRHDFVHRQRHSSAWSSRMRMRFPWRRTHLLDDVPQRGSSAGAGRRPAQHHVRPEHLGRVNVGGFPRDRYVAWIRGNEVEASQQHLLQKSHISSWRGAHSFL